jgi:glyoxylase I family protein
VRFFSHVGITVSSVDRGIAFYTDVLGFRVLFQSDHDGWRRVGLTLDEFTLELFSPHPTGQPIDPVDMLYPEPYRRPKVALTVVDIDAAWAELVERGVPVIGPIIDTGATRLFFILDPDGTLIQLHAVDLAVERAGALGVVGLRPERREPDLGVGDARDAGERDDGVGRGRRAVGRRRLVVVTAAGGEHEGEHGEEHEQPGEDERVQGQVPSFCGVSERRERGRAGKPDLGSGDGGRAAPNGPQSLEGDPQ